MTAGRPLAAVVVIDDLAASARFLAAPAARALSTTLERLHNGLLTLLSSFENWAILDYGGYVNWLRERVDIERIVLDRLLPRNGGDVTHVDLPAHRALDPTKGLTLELGTAGSKPGATLVDDATYTGETLVAAAMLTSARRAAVGVATPAALTRLRAADVETTAWQQTPPHADILHLRDFVPWLPFSGRRAVGFAPTDAVPTRIAPLLHDRGTWLHVQDNAAVHKLVHTETAAALKALEELLGERPRVGDLPRLGRGLAAPLADVTRRVIPDEALADLLAIGATT